MWSNRGKSGKRGNTCKCGKRVNKGKSKGVAMKVRVVTVVREVMEVRGERGLITHYGSI